MSSNFHVSVNEYVLGNEDFKYIYEGVKSIRSNTSINLLDPC